MEFKIERIENTSVSDTEIFNLLSEVYVQAGFTKPETATSIFEPRKVKNRGILFVCREVESKVLAGMVIVVPASSLAAVRAKENQCEMHLLGVLPRFRGHGLGRKLVEKTLEFATTNNFSKMILWTQKPMENAQRLYESSGFIRCGEMNKNGIDFFVYEKALT